MSDHDSQAESDSEAGSGTEGQSASSLSASSPDNEKTERLAVDKTYSDSQDSPVKPRSSKRDILRVTYNVCLMILTICYFAMYVCCK